jgi:hypothetical protein
MYDIPKLNGLLCMVSIPPTTPNSIRAAVHLNHTAAESEIIQSTTETRNLMNQ